MTDTPPPVDHPVFARPEVQARRRQVEERAAAETANPELRWRRLGAEAARDAVLAERHVPEEGVAAFRAGFDEALPVERERPLPRGEVDPAAVEEVLGPLLADATDEQRAAARDLFRRKRDEARARRGPEYRQALRDRFGITGQSPPGVGGKPT